MFLNLSIYIGMKLRQNIHICSILSLLKVYKFRTSKSFSYIFAFAEKFKKRRKAVLKTVKTFEYFLELEHLFTHEITPKYTDLYQIMSTISLQFWNFKII